MDEYCWVRVAMTYGNVYKTCCSYNIKIPNTWLGPVLISDKTFFARSREVSKPCVTLSDRFEIWQAPWQQCCRGACQISKRSDDLNYPSRGFETSRDPTIKRLIDIETRSRFLVHSVSFMETLTYLISLTMLDCYATLLSSVDDIVYDYDIDRYLIGTS